MTAVPYTPPVHCSFNPLKAGRWLRMNKCGLEVHLAKNPCIFPDESEYVPTIALRLFKPKGTVNPEFGNFTTIKVGLVSVASLVPSLASMVLANHPVEP